MAFGCPKWSLSSSIALEPKIRRLTHCSNYPRLGKIATDSTTRYRSCQSAPCWKKERKDVSIPVTSLKTAKILELLTPPLDSLSYAHLKRQGRRKPHQWLSELVAELTRDSCCLKCRHCGDPQLMLLVRPSWNLGLYCPTRQRHTKRGTKLVRTTTSLPGTLSKTGGTLRGALHLQYNET